MSSIRDLHSLSTARTTCTLKPKQSTKILCHRIRNKREEFLVRWTAESPAAVCSWHNLAELARCLHLVQSYVEDRQLSSRRTLQRTTTPSLPNASGPSNKRKRSFQGLAGKDGSRDVRNGMLTPALSAEGSGPSSVASANHSLKDLEADDTPDVYNGVLERKEGRIYVNKKTRASFVKVNAETLPTPSMIEEASTTPLSQAERAVREGFLAKIQKLPYVYLENNIDNSTPSLNFQFVNDYLPREGVHRTDPNEYKGCQEPCRPDMGQRIGCEYTQQCDCLEYAAVDTERLLKTKPEIHEIYMAASALGGEIDTRGLPKRFPYRRVHGKSTLQTFYRESRHPIYECNANCNCGPVCKSRVVQKGRSVPLTIFKTASRGWGVYCGEDLAAGEFIDTYLGEIITNDEADLREERAGKGKASYMYNLDKFVDDDNELDRDSCFVVDGQFFGGVTRFINHSCEPNCRQYTVSYNRHDIRVYDIAFFAYEDIPAGQELTFDYLDQDEEEEEDAVKKREEAARDPSNKNRVPCRCGARKCRGYLWF